MQLNQVLFVFYPKDYIKDIFV